LTESAENNEGKMENGVEREKEVDFGRKFLVSQKEKCIAMFVHLYNILSSFHLYNKCEKPD